MRARALALAGTALFAVLPWASVSQAQDSARQDTTQQDATQAEAQSPAATVVPVLTDDERALLALALRGADRIDPARDRWRNPAATLQFFGVRPGQTVVEVWPGQGWYTSILAPYIRAGGGNLIVAHFDPAASGQPAVARLVNGFGARFGTPETPLSVRPFGPETGPVAPAGTVDTVVTFRNVHNWMAQGWAEKAFADFYAMLRPGGILGIEEHRLDVSEPQDPTAATGYVREDFIIALAEEAGFEFVGRSEINANPADTRDHPFGVWTLPPVARTSPLGEPDDPSFDRRPYDRIGESDRMTLRFRKPLQPPPPVQVAARPAPAPGSGRGGTPVPVDFGNGRSRPAAPVAPPPEPPPPEPATRQAVTGTAPANPPRTGLTLPPPDPEPSGPVQPVQPIGPVAPVSQAARSRQPSTAGPGPTGGPASGREPGPDWRPVGPSLPSGAQWRPVGPSREAAPANAGPPARPAPPPPVSAAPAPPAVPVAAPSPTGTPEPGAPDLGAPPSEPPPQARPDAGRPSFVVPAETGPAASPPPAASGTANPVDPGPPAAAPAPPPAAVTAPPAPPPPAATPVARQLAPPPPAAGTAAAPPPPAAARRRSPPPPPAAARRPSPPPPPAATRRPSPPPPAARRPSPPPPPPAARRRSPPPPPARPRDPNKPDWIRPTRN